MKLNTLGSVCLAGVLSSASVGAEPLTIYELEGSTATYLEADLDREIYRFSRDPDLRDLLVLDAEGKELPSRIITLQPELMERSTAFPLSFYPVMAGDDPSAWLSRGGAELRIDEDAVFLRLDPEQRSRNTAADFYIIDITNLDKTLRVLEIDWLQESNEVVAVELSASNDLQRWARLTQQTLVHLNNEGESLLRNTVEVSIQPEQYGYLRLRFLGDAVIDVRNVLGHNITQHVGGPEPQRWRVRGALADDQRPLRLDRYGLAPEIGRTNIVAWEFHRNDRTPSNRIRIDLGDASYGDRVRLFSREHPSQSWVARHSAIWFNVKVGDHWQQSETIRVSSNRDALWRLELSNGDGLTDPQLVFEYPQQRLRFIANNNPPYSIAINDQIPARRTADEVFLRVLGGRDVSWERVDKQIVAGIQPIEHRVGFDWQALLFWGALAVAVVVLVVLAVRLIRQMDGVEK